MNLWKRGMVFVTFLGACLALGLLVAALTTRQWVTAKAVRTSNPNESQGRVALGLFHGKKELNVAYGWRSYDVNGEYSGLSPGGAAIESLTGEKVEYSATGHWSQLSNRRGAEAWRQ